MRGISGTFNGTGAAIYICLGFIPDWVKVLAVEDADSAFAVWSRFFNAAESNNGIVDVKGDTARTEYTKGQGIVPYEGGETLTAAMQTSVSYGNGVYLVQDSILDYSKDLTYGGVSALTTWTLGNSGNCTGNANDDTVASSRIGEGSRIVIKETGSGTVKEAVVEAWTAGQGISANEITLSRAIASGTILSISGMYDLVPLAVGKVTPAGFKLNATTYVNVDDEINLFEAILFDR